MTEITKSTEAKKDEMQVEKEKLESVKRADAAVKTMHDFTSPEVLYKELINSVLKYHPSTDISMIEKAYKVASEAHEGQKRKSGEPYIIHPLCVAIILAELELDKETIVAGILHDAGKLGTKNQDDFKNIRKLGDKVHKHGLDHSTAGGRLALELIK